MAVKQRLTIALVTLLSGLALIPFIALPQEGFSWQRFSGAYGSTPALASNHTSGSPGSFFSLTGYNFPPGSTVQITVNGVVIGSVVATATGGFSVTLSTQGAELGAYRVVAAVTNNPEDEEVFATLTLRLVVGATVHTREGNDPLFVLPADLAQQELFLPLVAR